MSPEPPPNEAEAEARIPPREPLLIGSSSSEVESSLTRSPIEAKPFFVPIDESILSSSTTSELSPRYDLASEGFRPTWVRVCG